MQRPHWLAVLLHHSSHHTPSLTFLLTHRHFLLTHSFILTHTLTHSQGLTYDQAQATINGTVGVQLPRWLEVLLHHSNHHLPSHLSISIPSYNLPAAQVGGGFRLWGRGVHGAMRCCAGHVGVLAHVADPLGGNVWKWSPLVQHWTKYMY